MFTEFVNSSLLLESNVLVDDSGRELVVQDNGPRVQDDLLNNELLASMAHVITSSCCHSPAWHKEYPTCYQTNQGIQVNH